MAEKQTQVVMTADLARYLLSKGFVIIDLDKHRADAKQTVFIFEYTEKLQKEMDTYFKAKKVANSTA